jgi:serine/threonine-protein kinase SRPK3
MTLKIMRADLSSKPINEIPDLVVPRKLSEYALAEAPLSRPNIQTIEDHFMENGPNGSHLCLVSQFAGPSIRSLLDCTSSRRLRNDLAREVAKQVVGTVELMHTAGFVHGGSLRIL